MSPTVTTSWERRCDQCDRAYVTSSVRSRYCSSTCRGRVHRAQLARGGEQVPAAPPAAEPQQASEPAAAASGAMVEATRTELEQVGRAGTALGAAALHLAGRLDRGHAESGSNVAALSREWRAVLAAATAGAGRSASATERARDELQARRSRRA